MSARHELAAAQRKLSELATSLKDRVATWASVNGHAQTAIIIAPDPVPVLVPVEANTIASRRRRRQLSEVA